jgi:cysteinyl-tRNA synthetase
VMVSDLLRSCSADALRLYLADHHYRQAWSYDEDELYEAGRFADLLREAAEVASPHGAELESGAAQAAFRAAMDDDLNSQGGLKALRSLASEIIDGAQSGRDVRAAQNSLRLLGTVFGLQLDAQAPEERVIAGWNLHQERFQG